MPEPRFDVRLVAYTPNGARLGLLPEPLELQAAFPHNDAGALTASYSRHALRGELLDRALSTGLEIAVEVTTHDGTWVEPDGARFVWVARDSDLADRASLVKITAPSWGWLLSKARLLSLDNLLPPEHTQAGRRPFYSATAGTIIRTLMAENAARGGVPVSLTFQPTTDSAGVAWAFVATLYYEPGLELSVILGNLADQGMCDWRTRGRALHLWNPDTVCAPDLAAAVRLHLGRDVGEAPSTESIQDVVSRVLLRGDGMALTLDNPTAPTPWGAWEGYLSQGGVSDPATATQLVQTELDRRARTTAQYTRSLILPGARHWPMVDYTPGAWITAPTSTAAERVRVAQVTLTRDANGVGGSVVLNDRILDAELRRAKRIAGIVGGSQADGGAGTRPAPEGPDRRTPAAPLGLVVDTDAYLDPAGIARGLVTAGWAAVITATDGTAMEIAGYELALRDNAVGAPWSVVRSTEDTTTTYGPAEVGRTMQAKVRAVGRYSTVPGAWSTVVTFTVEDDVTPPPVPTVPTVAVDRAVVQVRWDGKTSTGGTMPADFHRVELEREAAAGQVAGTILDAIGGTVLIAYLPLGTAQRFRARAVDRTGNASAWSGWSAYVTPKPLVSADIDAQITGAITAAQQSADRAQTSADGKNTVWFQTSAPSGTAHRVGDTWFDTDDGNRVYRWSGSAWVAAQFGTDAIANLAITNALIADATIQAAKIGSVDAGSITTGYLDAGRIAARTITTDKLIVSSGVNAVPNGSFEQELAGWTTQARYQVVTTEHRTGARAVEVAAATGAGTIRPVADIPVQAGERWLFTAWCKTTTNYNGTAGNGKLRIANQAGALLGAVAWPVTTEWQQVSYAYTVAAGVSAVRPELVADHTAGTLWVDDVAAIRMTDGQLIVDGAITTRLLGADAVTAANIAANSIEADHISFGALDGYVITGALIRTAESGARVELNASNLRAYNSAGTVTAEINGASSTFTGGTFQTSGSGGRTVMSPTGIQVYDTTGTEQVRLAHTLTRGLAVRNPNSNTLTELGPVAFGVQAGWSSATLIRAVSSTRYVDTRVTLTFVAPSSRLVIMVYTNGGYQGGPAAVNDDWADVTLGVNVNSTAYNLQQGGVIPCNGFALVLAGMRIVTVTPGATITVNAAWVAPGYTGVSGQELVSRTLGVVAIPC